MIALSHESALAVRSFRRFTNHPMTLVSALSIDSEVQGPRSSGDVRLYIEHDVRNEYLRGAG